MHKEVEISERAIKNLESKINLKTINLAEMDLNLINKLILAIAECINKYSINTYESQLYKAIFIAKEALLYTNELILCNLRANNILNLFSNVMNMNFNQNINDICEEFIKVFLSRENQQDNPNPPNNKINYNIHISNNYSIDREQTFGANTIGSNRLIAENEYNKSSNIIKDNDQTLNHNLAEKINEAGNYTMNSSVINQSSNFNCDNKDKKKSLSNIETIKASKNSNIVKNKVLMIDIDKQNYSNKHPENKEETKENNIHNKDFSEANFSINGTSSFPLINISKKEEQIIYDYNINLKFGDSLHVSKTLHFFYYNILEEFPIEYLLQNSEIIKSILIILEKSNHLEYGNILFSILDKFFYLIERKINLYSHNLLSTFNNLRNNKNNNQRDKSIFKINKLLFYPITIPDDLNEYKLISEMHNRYTNLDHCISVRDFIIVSAEALIISAYNTDKLTFAIILLEKNFTILRKLMIDINDDEWTIIIRLLINKLNDLIQFYKLKKLNFHNISLLLFRFLLSLSDSALIKFLINTNFELIQVVNNNIYIFDERQSNLCEKLLNKLRKILNKIQNNNTNNIYNELIEKLNILFEEYKKAEIIKSSIDIAKRVNENIINNFNNKTQDNKKIISYSVNEMKFILDNFDNLLLAYKYFIDSFLNFDIKEFYTQQNSFGYNCNPNQNKINNMYNRYPSYTSNSNINEEFDERNEQEYNTNANFSFIKFLGFCVSYLNNNENYLSGRDKNKALEFTYKELSNCFAKILTFLNSINSLIPYKNLVYYELLQEVKINDSMLFIFNENASLFLGLVNDLTDGIHNKNERLEICILEIIHEVIFKSILFDNKKSQEFNKLKIFYQLFEILPIYPKNLKMLSLNAKIEKKFSNSNAKILKYLRLLFSNSEFIRLNAINYFKHVLNLNNNINNLNEKTIEFVEFTANYNCLKKLDLIYLIQTAEKEYTGYYNNIISNLSNLEIEFFPLLNILYSNKIDNNLKTSAIEQLIYLTVEKKYSSNFCHEIFFFSFDILFNKFLEYKNFFEQTIIMSKDNFETGINNINNNNENFFLRYNNINTFIDNFYKDSNLNYISSLLKLVNLIILNNSENNSIKNFLIIKNNENLLQFIHAIIIQLFPSEALENLLNADVRKPKNKHLLNVNLVFFIYLVSFNLKNSFHKNISQGINFAPIESQINTIDHSENKFLENKKYFLIQNYSSLSLQKYHYHNIMPLKNNLSFQVNYNLNYENSDTPVDEYNSNYKNLIIPESTKWHNYEIKKNIIEYIQYKAFYDNSQINQDSKEKLLNEIYDLPSLKKTLTSLFNNTNSQYNYMEIFINSSKIFECYIYENFKALYNYVKSKQKKETEDKDDSIPNINNSTNYVVANDKKPFNSELCYFENKESNILILILSFLKCTSPQCSEEKNIIIDILNSIKIFISFHKSLLNFDNHDKTSKIEIKDKINIINYEKCLKELEAQQDTVSLPLIKKGLNECVYNYLTFICNNKNFTIDLQKNFDNQSFLIEILNLIVSNPEIFDMEFYSINIQAIMYLIKNFINILYNNDNFLTIRILITKLGINLFRFLSIVKKNQEKNAKNVKYENFYNSVIQNSNLFRILLESIDFFVSNFKHSKLGNIKERNFNQKNNFAEFEENAYSNLHKYHPSNNDSLSFKDVCLLKNNLVLLTLIIEANNSPSLELNITNKSFTLLKYLEFNQSEDPNIFIDNVIYSDVIILIINIFEKIKSNEAKMDVIKKNPILLSNMFDFILNFSSSALLVVTISNFLNVVIDSIIQNYTMFKMESNNHSRKTNNRNRNENTIKNLDNVDNLDNINPINEYGLLNSNVDFKNNIVNEFENNNNLELNEDNCENLIDDIIILNEKIYDASAFMNIINIIKKNIKNTLVCSNLLSLLKKLINLSKLKNEDKNFNITGFNFDVSEFNYNSMNEKFTINNIFDLITNSSLFELLNDLVKHQNEKFKLIVNFSSEDFLNVYFPIFYKNQTQSNYSVGYFNTIYFDKIHSKINKLHEISESFILIGDIIDIFNMICAKNSDFVRMYKENKIIILENLNNIFNVMNILKSIKNRINPKDYSLFYEQNKFSEIFRSLVIRYFSLLHLLYFKDEEIINENFLEISICIKDIFNTNLKNKFLNVNEINSNLNLHYSLMNNLKKKIYVDYEKESSINNESVALNQNEIKGTNASNAFDENSSANIEAYLKNCKAFRFIELCYDLLVFEENKDISVKVYFSKVLPNLIETIIYFNKIIESSDLYANNIVFENEAKLKNMKINDSNRSNISNYQYYGSQFKNEYRNKNSGKILGLQLKNEGDTILKLMTGLKDVYKIKYDNYDFRIKCKFTLEYADLTEKNTLIYGISTLLLVSQKAKKLFIKSNFISTFIDYIRQLSDKLLDISLESRDKEAKTKAKFLDDNFYRANITERNNLLEYLISEYKNVLVLLQNLFCNFEDCEEKNSLFISLDIINQNFLSTNVTNLTNINSSKCDINNSIGNKINLTNQSFNSSKNHRTNSISNSKILKNKNSYTSKLLVKPIKEKEYELENMSMGNISNYNNERTVNLTKKPNVENVLAINFIKTLYEIFHDTLKYDIIHENYIKLLINIISKNDHAKKSFIVSVSNPDSIGNKDSFIIILLEYLNKRFLNNNLNNTFFSNEQNLTGLDLFIKLLKCLFQNKQIVLFLLKIKFVENFQKDILGLIQNKKYYTNKSNQVCLNFLLSLLVSLTFDSEVRRKIVDKDLIEVFTDSIIKIRNENIIFNILFIFRNLAFVNQNKAHFLSNENLLGTIFAVLSGDLSLKIKYMISHLIWILLFNNQTVKIFNINTRNIYNQKIF